MTRTVTTLSLALFLGFATLAAAGGENCDKAHAAKARTAAHQKADEKAKHGWLGLETEKNAAGAYVVAGVADGSPAEKAGFQKGDVLVAFNGIALTDENKEALKKAKMQNAVGKQVTYTITRSGSQRQIAATLAEVPEEVLAAWKKEYDKALAVAQTDN